MWPERARRGRERPAFKLAECENNEERQLEPAVLPSNKRVAGNFSQPNAVRITKYLYESAFG